MRRRIKRMFCNRYTPPVTDCTGYNTVTYKKDSLLDYRLLDILPRDANALKWRHGISDTEIRQELVGMWTA